MFEKHIKTGLIGPDELKACLDEPEKAGRIKILDASMNVPGADYAPKEGFIEQHIPGAQFLDIKEICVHDPLPNTLPGAQVFEEAVRELGISNEDFIVIYGQKDIAKGPARGWWMFRVFGHDRVCLLNGGLQGWIKAGHKTIRKEVTYPPSRFKAVFREEFVADLPQVQKACNTGSALILDARAFKRFSGQSDEPREGLLPGHIPGSSNIPASEVLAADSMTLKSAQDIKNILPAAYRPEKSVITSCGSGITACALAFALHHIGHQNWAVYDGSWSEWGQEKLDTVKEKEHVK